MCVCLNLRFIYLKIVFVHKCFSISVQYLIVGIFYAQYKCLSVIQFFVISSTKMDVFT